MNCPNCEETLFAGEERIGDHVFNLNNEGQATTTLNCVGCGASVSIETYTGFRPISYQLYVGGKKTTLFVKRRKEDNEMCD